MGVRINGDTYSGYSVNVNSFPQGCSFLFLLLIFPLKAYPLATSLFNSSS
jgi:hypothetical protein